MLSDKEKIGIKWEDFWAGVGFGILIGLDLAFYVIK